MSRRRETQARAHHERWLVSYADFITLLFAFFVVLYASSQMDKKKGGASIRGDQGRIRATGSVFRQCAPDVHAQQPPDTAAITPWPRERPRRSRSRGSVSRTWTSSSSDLQDALGEQIKKHEIEIHATPEGLSREPARNRIFQ